MKEVIKKGVINTLAASGDNLYTDADHGEHMIVADNTADPLVPIIPFKIKPNSVKSINYVAAAEEVRRAWVIGVLNEETIVAGTKYSIEIDYAQYKRNSTRRGAAYKYGYTSPAVLSGDADTDRENVYTALKNKIEAHTGNFVEAKLLTKIEGLTAAGNLDEVTVGATVMQTDNTEAAADWTAKVAYVQSTWSGTVDLYVYDTDGTLDAATDKSLQVGDYVTGDGSTLEAISTNAAQTAVDGQGLFILDDAGYWITPDQNRPGASSVILTNGFSTSVATISRDVTYAQGQGDVMLAMKPVYNYKSDDIISGDIEYTFNQDPISTKAYTLAIIELENRAEPTAGFDQVPTQNVQLHLYMDESNGTNLTNLKSALDAIVGL